MKHKQDHHRKLESQLLRAGRLTSEWGEGSEAMFMNSSYRYDSAEQGEARFDGTEPGFRYGRYSHPNLAMLQERIALLEDAPGAVVTASGMAAVFAALLSQLKAGDHVVASAVLFSSCHYIITELLPRYGISYQLVAGNNPDDWQQAITAKTRCVFIETPCNPTLDIVDIAMVATLCKQHSACFIVDNVFATGWVQQPLKLGADLIVYSTTKHIDGQGRSLGGAICGGSEIINDVLMPFIRHTGPHMSPFTAWLLLKSLETFPLRIAKHCANADAIAHALAAHPAIEALYYPGHESHPDYAIAAQQMHGGGPMLAVKIKGGKKQAFKFMNALQLFDISNNLGNAKSLITHPATTTHSLLEREQREAIGITDNLLRLSPGIENAADLTDDLNQALSAL